MASDIQITLPDGSVRQYPSGVTAMDIATDISPGLARNVLTAEVNGAIWEASRPIQEDATVRLLTWRDELGKASFWHSSAHIMAEALEALYPGVKLAYGPPVEDGFYYDVDFGEHSFSSDDFPKIEEKFKELARSGEVFEREVVSRDHAINFYKDRGNNYKVELIERLPEEETITFYHSGKFTDLCRGGHIPNSKIVKAVKLMKVAGAYFMGDETRPQLTRVYGITFPKQKELDEYLEMLELAKERDHRKLGRELELFTFSEEVGMGLPMWLPKGAALRHRLEEFLKEKQADHGYEQVISPHIGKKELYVTSGHYAKYGKDSFQPIKTPHEGEEYFLKAMNCPHHCIMYKAKPRSYRDLPVRFAEFGTVYRYEQHGELHGLTRVRGFTQDDAHLFCRADQVKEEFKKVIEIVLYILGTLEFDDYTAQISLRDPNNPDKYLGDPADWDKSEQAIIEAAEEMGLNTVQVEGEAAFYGPKLDFMVRDALKREWQLGTVQVDYNLPKRFELEYTGADNQKHTPVMIHRAPFGSMERFIAVLLEHTGGRLPLWLATDQVSVLPISDKYNDYAEKVLNYLKSSDIRGFVDDRSEKIGRKIRDAEVNKTPFMLIVGEKEADNQEVSVRRHQEGDLGSMSLDAFAQLVHDEETKSLKVKE